MRFGLWISPSCFFALGELHAFICYRSCIQNGSHFGFYFFKKAQINTKSQETKRFSCLMLMFFEQLKIMTVNY